MPPPATPSPIRLLLIRLALAIYWAILITVTHLPGINKSTTPDWGALPFDKTMHVLTFGGLAGWLCWSRFIRRAGPWPNAALAAGIGMIYGVLEEMTQPWFGRTNDPGDLIADALGLLIGATLSALLWKLPHRPPVSEPA